MADDLQPIIGRYKVADHDADAELARNSVRARLFGGKKKKTRIGKYALGKLVGVGGMGRVYVAHDRELDRRVALKLLKGSQWTGSGGEEGRLWREARTLAQINHRNVVTVYEVGEASMGVFVAMEFIQGRTLRQWVNDEDPGTREVLRVLREAGHGLAAAHAAGIVHRDFKPDNVLIGNDGRVCVVDFGIAHDVSVVPELEFKREDYMTTTGRESLLSSGPAGTPAYMAPERLDGRDADVAGDIYSFCVCTWEALTGYLPDPYTDAPPTDPRRVVPRRIRAAVERGLSHDPKARQSSVAKLLEPFDRQLDQRQRATRVWAGAGVLLAGLGVGAWLRSPPGLLPAPPESIAEAEASVPPVILPKRELAERIGCSGGPDSERPRRVVYRDPQDPLGTTAATLPILSGALASPTDGLRRDDPAAYATQARAMHALALRWRASAGDDPARGVRFVGHLPPSGLRLSPPEYAALASAAYDGHREALGAKTGVRTAAPDMTVIADGISGRTSRPAVWRDTTLDYLDGIRAWSVRHREGDFPADVVGLHLELRDPRAHTSTSPESAEVHTLLRSVAQWRDAQAPGRELWVTRFGYDTHPGSALRPGTVPGVSADLVHAQWTVRATLLLLAGGADRVMLGTWADEGESPAPGTTSGLRGPGAGHDPKPALRHLETLQRTVGDFALDGLIKDLPEPVFAVRLSRADGRQAVVAWLGTHTGEVRTNVPLPVTVGADVTLTPLDDVSQTRTMEAELRLDLSETPLVAVW